MTTRAALKAARQANLAARAASTPKQPPAGTPPQPLHRATSLTNDKGPPRLITGVARAALIAAENAKPKPNGCC